MNSADPIDLSATVRAALDRREPVVVLESSVLAQGLPIPANRRAAEQMVGAVESRGATAAISGIARGRPTLGIEGADLERFLRREGVWKVSARDLGVVVSRDGDGATTVAATLVLARAAGIEVFATGGIGGVHRASRTSARSQVFDESADLLELARSRVVVVCAGAKSILDLPATWERLETLGIPVVGYRTSELPGFFTAHTGIALSVRCDTAGEIARLARSHWSMGNGQAVVVVQPPPEERALSRDQMEQIIDQAVADAESQGIEGPATTPFLLEAVNRLTNGRSLEVNLGLLERNAGLAADIASALVAQHSAVSAT